MTARRMVGAATAVLLTGTLLGHVPAATAAGDKRRNDWDDKRVLQAPGTDGGAVHILTNRRKMVTVIRELGAGSDSWRIRESRDGGLRFSPRLEGARTVDRFRYDGSGSKGTTYATYEHDGRLWAGEADARRAIVLTTRTYLVAAGTQAPKVVAGESDKDHALITQDGTWHQHFGPVGGADPRTTPNDGGEASRWVSYPDPNVDGVPGNAGQDYAFAGGDLVTFWNAADGDLMAAGRAAQDTTAAWSAAQKVAAGEKYVDYVETAQGGRLVTQADDGSVNLHSYTSDAAGFSFTDRRQLAGASAHAPAPHVLVDALGTLTVAWREPGVTGGGLVLWQEDRPGSGFLERPRMTPGTRDAEARVVTSPRGNLTVAMRRDSETGIVRVKHLPAGKKKWTGSVRLVSPKPLDTSGEWGIGSPRRNGDMRVAVNDRVGVYGFRYVAPRPITKVTKPVRKVQAKRKYRVGWNTTWAFADHWELRARVDQGKRYEKWKRISPTDGFTVQWKKVTRPRGEKRCYSARGSTIDGGWTKWSEQRCVKVRR